MWILIGLLLGSTVTSTHTDREACEGRKVMLAEKGVTGLKCEDMKTGALYIQSCGSTTCFTR